MSHIRHQMSSRSGYLKRVRRTGSLLPGALRRCLGMLGHSSSFDSMESQLMRQRDRVKVLSEPPHHPRPRTVDQKRFHMFFSTGSYTDSWLGIHSCRVEEWNCRDDEEHEENLVAREKGEMIPGTSTGSRISALAKEASPATSNFQQPHKFPFAEFRISRHYIYCPSGTLGQH